MPCPTLVLSTGGPLGPWPISNRTRLCSGSGKGRTHASLPFFLPSQNERTSGIVERHAYLRRPLRYDYRLSEAGRDLVPAILALTAWGDRWARPKEGSPMLFVHKTCGQRFEPHVTCSACGEAVTADNVLTLGGPGGAMKTGTRVLARRLGARG